MVELAPFRVVTVFLVDSITIGDRLRGINDFNAELLGRGERPLRLLYNLLPETSGEVAHEGMIILQHPRTEALAKAMKGSRVPTVSLHESWRGYLPGTYVDDYQVGVTGAQYLLQRGFERFAFCSFRDAPWAQERRRGFAECLGRQGKQCDVYDMWLWSLGELHRSDETPELVDWLKGLRRPTGLMCSADFQAVQMIDRIMRLGMRVPEDVAVLSFDNNVTLCTMAKPTLSSIQADDRAAGYRAAAMLYEMMQANSPRSIAAGNWNPPMHVVERDSTDIYGFADREVAEAYRMILQPGGTVTVKELIERLMIPRRSLELRFKSVLGITPGEQIRRTRLSRAQAMLRETSLSIDAVARRSGFADAQAMARVFKRECKQSPRAYRHQHRAGIRANRSTDVDHYER